MANSWFLDKLIIEVKSVTSDIESIRMSLEEKSLQELLEIKKRNEK